MDRGFKITAALMAVLLALDLAACSASTESRMAPDVLSQSWKAYVARFIQKDGRVIDYRAHGISTSEGQAYAMLRAVWMADRPTFDRTCHWAVNNLNAGVRKDHLWAWKWGEDATHKWHALDTAFATDADQDAAFALILAAGQWKEPKYLAAAQAMLADLWKEATVKIGPRRYLLAGDSLCKGADCRVNPSYYAPYAYRIFAAHDKAHDWASLADSSYAFLEAVSRLTATGLPPDWVQLNRANGVAKLAGAKDSAFSYDAFRVFWRVALDGELNKEPRAQQYLKHSLVWIDRQWTWNGMVPAAVGVRGTSDVEYQSLEMLSGVMPAMRMVDAKVAAEMFQKVQSVWAQGIWGENDSDYLQNWAWFGTALYDGYLGPLRRN